MPLAILVMFMFFAALVAFVILVEYTYLYKYSLLIFGIILVCIAWIVVAFNEQETIIIGVYEVKHIDVLGNKVPIIVVEDEIIPLGDLFKYNLDEGVKVQVSKNSSLSYGIHCMNTCKQYKVLPRETDE